MRLFQLPLGLKLTIKLTSVLCVFLILTAATVEGQSLCDAACGNTVSPSASAGGPYIGIIGQTVSLDSSGSWCNEGWISGYYWDFGDGTSGSGPNPNHVYSADGVYSVTLWVSDSNGNWASSQSFVTVSSVALPIKIHFDDLPNNTVVADQYLGPVGVRFSSNNFFFPTHTQQFCGFCSTTSLPNFLTTKPDDVGQVNVEFTQPVSNLSFFMIGVGAFFNSFAVVDVFQNGSFSNSFTIFGNGTRTVGITFGSTTNISKIVVRNITDPDGIGFDDFTFNVPADIKITNPRVTGPLNGSTRNALLGADITLTATPTPGAFAGGTFSWTFTGPFSVSGGGVNAPTIVIRATDVGTITAKVTYTKSNLTSIAQVTINSKLPTLTSFTAQQGRDQVLAPGTCLQIDSFWRYRLGCTQTSPPQDRGMHFTATVHADPFISDPTQSGIKYAQAVSTFTKKMERGLRCVTKRTSKTNVDSGWQVDKDPYVFLDNSFPVKRFSEGNDLTMPTVDYPSNTLTFVTDWEFVDVLYVDDRFKMYVVYFTFDPANSPVNRTLGKLEWNWGGQVVFQSNGNRTIQFSNAAPGPRVGVVATTQIPTQGPVTKSDVQCPDGGPPLSTSKIDSARLFVKFHYIDFLERNPAGDTKHPPDIPGWDFWTGDISKCIFDLNCIHTQRIHTGQAFFAASEFIQSDPVMANGPGTPGFDPPVYNRRFVFWCYQTYLDRDPTGDPGWDFWTNVLNSDNNYAHIIDAFQLSLDYRNRAFF